MGAVGPQERLLAWDGCFNVRDLGGLETAAGGRTRYGTVVRADNVRHLTADGWRAARSHGVRRLVDLRFENESPGDPGVPDGVDVVAVSLFGSHDPAAAASFDERVLEADDVASVFAAGYIRTLERSSERVVAAVAAVADTDPADVVVVHCWAGKDRTGIVAALLLASVGVPDEVVAADYAVSGPNVAALSASWFESSRDEVELELRRRLVQSPRAAMVEVLEWVRRKEGGAGAYLRHAGLSDGQLERLQARLVEP